MRTSLTASSATSRNVKLAGQLSLVALLAGLGSACSSMGPLSGPMFTGSTSNQQQILAGGGGSAAPMAAYGAAPTASVHGNDLPPPAGVQATYAPTAAPQAPQAYVPPKPYAAAGLPTPMGQVGSQPAAPTLASLGAPPTTLNAQAARFQGGSGAGSTHVVQAGDTMYNIARRYGISVDALIAANGGSTVAPLGQRVTIPGGGAAPQSNIQMASVDPQAVPVPAPAVLAPAPVPAGLPPAAAVAPAPAPAPTQDVSLAPQTGTAGAMTADAPQPGAAASGFRWPVRGRVISGFGKRPNGERNDGINLAVPEGTAVKAAEDGTVIYAGNELKSYGNLILVRHANGWVSAYAHNSELKVARGDQIRRGQIVALSGMSGGVTTPQVHFELRKDATPVDPLQHLTES